MTTETSQLTANPYQSSQAAVEVGAYTYDRWMEPVGIPIYRGFFIEDLRTIELGGGTNANVLPRLFNWWGRRELLPPRSWRSPQRKPCRR